MKIYNILEIKVKEMIGMKIGERNIIIKNKREIKRLVKEMKKYKVKILKGIKKMLKGMIKKKELKKIDLKKIIIKMGGGMEVKRKVEERWKKMKG